MSVTPPPIPLADLRAQYAAARTEIDTAIREVIDECAFVGGLSNKRVDAFERAFARYVGVDHCVSCANGTDAIELALAALGIGPGAEVIVPALSWISTAEAVSNVGAKPIFADIETYSCAIDPAQVERLIGRATKAIIVVHLHGRPADCDAIVALAARRGISVIEDCAQSHGAKLRGRMTGSIGTVAAFSFFPSKNLGAFGDGGAVLTNDEALSHRIRLIANHGQPRKNEHLIVGRNSRLDGIQAAVLAAKLPFLDAWNDARRRAAETLRAKLAHLEPDLQLPMIEPDRDHVFHIFAVEHERRDELAEALRVEGIGTGVHYPVPMPLTPAYASLGGTAAEFPNAVRHSNRLLSLPLFAEITPAQLDRIAARVSTFVKGG